MDSYCYPGSQVLDNKAELRDAASLRTHEARLVFKRLIELYANPCPAKFDLPHLLGIYRALFQDVYAWAGGIRSGDMSLGSQMFCRAQFLESSLTSLFGQLADENWLRGLNVDGFACRAGFYLNELNAIHPFRDGNGRTQREFLRQLGIQTGHKVRWATVTRFEMYNASKLSMATGKPNGLVYVMRKR